MLQNIEYSEDYIEKAFVAWYNSDRKIKSLIGVLPRDESNRKPHVHTVQDWIEKYGWIERADVLDAAASQVIEKELIDKRVEMMRQLAVDGEKLKEKGLEHLKANPFDSSAAAVRAVVDGAKMQFAYTGMADAMVKIGQMSDKQLDARLRQILSKDNDDTISVDATDVEDTDADSPATDDHDQ